MRFLYFVLLGILAIILQTTLISFPVLGGIKPDLCLLVVFYSALDFKVGKSTVIAGAMGLIQDIFSGSVLGFNIFVKVAIGYFVSSSKTKINVEYLSTQVPVLFFLSFGDGILYFFIGSLFYNFYSFSRALVYHILPQAFFTSLIVLFIPVIKILINNIKKKFRIQPRYLIES